MKILQIHSLYEQYFPEFYGKFIGLSSASFDLQMESLLKDGFGGSHFFAPYMNRIGYEGRLVISNCREAQFAWLREHGEAPADGDEWEIEIPLKQVEEFQPDILYLSDSGKFNRDFISRLKWKPQLILGFRGVLFGEKDDLSDFDVLMSNSTEILAQALQLGAQATETFTPAMPERIISAVEDMPACFDVVFAGSYTPMHAKRNSYLEHIARMSRQTGGYSVAFCLLNSIPLPSEVAEFAYPPQMGIGMYKMLRSGRIVFNADIDFAHNESGNMRLFEATAIGSFVLTEYKDNITKYFEPGVEVETFRDNDELVSKIRYYLAHPEKRDAIALRGQRRCLEENSMDKRTHELDAVIKKHLAIKAAKNAETGSERRATIVKPDTARKIDTLRQAAYKSADEIPRSFCGTEALRTSAEHHLSQGNVLQAHELLVKAKALKNPLEGVDLLRAKCFMAMEQPAGAIEALREELRWFPENLDARELLDALNAQAPAVVEFKSGDEEFDGVLRIIKPYTMLSEMRLYNLYKMARHICESGIQGNFVECGVAAGGSSALLAWVIKMYSHHPRKLFAFDSFSGMPSPTANDSHSGMDAESTGWGTGTCSAPESSVIQACSKLGVADVLTTVKGYFQDTLPQIRDWVGMVALLHMDGDWYDSTRTILDNLYDRLVNGAFVQVDDYGYWEGCRKAIHEFMDARSLQFDMKQIDATGVWFVKPDTFRRSPDIPELLVREFLQDDPVSMGIESQMSVNERFQLYYAVRRLMPVKRAPLRFIEIGSYSGASLMLICHAMKRLGNEYQGISIEPAGTAQFCDVVSKFSQDVIHFPLYSHQAFLRLSIMFDGHNLPGLIFVDGDHSYEGVRQDIIDYYQLLAPGGIMLFHDYLPEPDRFNEAAIYSHHDNVEPGIRRACQEILEAGYQLVPVELPLLYPDDPTQTQAYLPIIPGVFSTMRAYRKPE